MGRRDGIKVKVGAMQKLQVRLMPKRCDSDCYINQKVDVTELVDYLEKYNKKNKNEKITYFHAFSTAIAKVIYNRPLLNRFIINKKYYDRNEVSLAFAAKVSFNDKSKEILSVIKVAEDDNVLALSEKIRSRVDKIRSKSSDLGDTDKAMEFLAKLPGPILSFLVWVIKRLDNHDMLPSSVTRDSLYHSTMILSNVGAIGGGALYHHLTDFGTSSILMTMGKIYKQKVIGDDGKSSVRSFCDFGITLDERIADGFYFIKSFKYFEEIMKKPELLFEEVSRKVELDEE